MPEIAKVWELKRQSSTNPKYGTTIDRLPIQTLMKTGLVIIDKPSGPTSHQVSAYVRDILGLKKCGHSGTLDPNVTGVLPVALEASTRLVHSLLPAGKEYICLMHLHKPVETGALHTVLEHFRGNITQLPPVRSAVKRAKRQRNIYSLDVLDSIEQDILYRVNCQAGTYIRKLCHDIGRDLEVGAHMQELRRTRAGPYTEDQAIRLQDLVDGMHDFKSGNETTLRKLILPRESAISPLGQIVVLDSAINGLCHGQSLKVPGIAKLTAGIQIGDEIALLSLKGELVSIATAQMSTKDILSSERGIAAKSAQVLMEEGMYPKLEH